MTMQGTTVDFSELERSLRETGAGRSQVIRILQQVQEEYRYLPEEALRRVCELTEITPAQIVGVASFYSQFRFQPTGEHRIRVCHGTACHVKGSRLIQEATQRHLKIDDGEDTDSERQFTVEKVACLGCCTLSPVVQIDDVVYGRLTPEKVSRAVNDFLSREDSDRERKVAGLEPVAGKGDGEIRIGLGSCCVAKGSDNLRLAIEEELERLGSTAPVKRVGCVGMCHRTPLVEVVFPGKPSTLYAEVQPSEARSIVNRHFKPQSLLKRFRKSISGLVDKVFEDEAWDVIDRYSIDVRDAPVSAFLDKQVHIATEHFGHLNPFDLEEYRESGGFAGLLKCLHRLSPEEAIEEVRQSGLRGRGGAGYPSGQKWSVVRNAAGDEKYVICNGDEGDPGAFMDRMLLESFPYRVLEGMAIAAYAVGSRKGIFYVRAEYPLALKVLREAIKRCRASGYLGENLFGTDLSFDVEIKEGAGAFVSGEETALLAAVEGKRSIPRLRPPYPAEKGLWGQPTLINNVETYASVPWILRNGGEAYSRFGTEKSRGTKVFALAGKVARGGLIEVPMGMTLREIVEEIGGGIEDGKKFKAVQVGGPSGGCVPARLADTPVDYEALHSVGAIMGSGGLVVLDDSDCMVDIARYFLQFTQNESCGKCTPCRIGSKRMLEIVTGLCEGRGKKGDLERLEELGKQMKMASFCGLGKTAPNPVLTSLKYFREEYEAHLEGRCPAGKCKDLIRYSITDDCIGCTICYQHCPVDAIASVPYKVHEIDPDKCTRCDMCRSVCPENAVMVN